MGIFKGAGYQICGPSFSWPIYSISPHHFYASGRQVQHLFQSEQNSKNRTSGSEKETNGCTSARPPVWQWRARRGNDFLLEFSSPIGVWWCKNFVAPYSHHRGRSNTAPFESLLNSEVVGAKPLVYMAAMLGVKKCTGNQATRKRNLPHDFAT